MALAISGQNFPFLHKTDLFTTSSTQNVRISVRYLRQLTHLFPLDTF